ncbi:hypothetical protein C1645_832933 [Glomus cerebriforme]|uniref:Endonuclease/exonuclease/phosphatase domain-containing protein n=1 Tax=Glomus cerebriforme TaxID=658196 RepID=A0A397SH07_9GLOM|nr:hypothetical protein C1645_832933 [Glomus cerebriforme]
MTVKMLKNKGYINVHKQIVKLEVTWKGHNGESRIDFIWVNDLLVDRIKSFKIKNLKKYTKSNHKILQIKLDKNKEKSEGKGKLEKIRKIDKEKITEQIWSQFSDEVEKIIQNHNWAILKTLMRWKEMKIKEVKNINIGNLDQMKELKRKWKKREKKEDKNDRNGQYKFSDKEKRRMDEKRPRENDKKHTMGKENS